MKLDARVCQGAAMLRDTTAGCGLSLNRAGITQPMKPMNLNALSHIFHWVVFR